MPIFSENCFATSSASDESFRTTEKQNAVITAVVVVVVEVDQVTVEVVTVVLVIVDVDVEVGTGPPRAVQSQRSES